MPLISGKHPCLICEIDSEHMQQSLVTRGRFPDRSLETITANYQAFMANGGIRKDAMEYCNCISEPLFNIPISHVSSYIFSTPNMFYTHKQVCPPGLHMTQGIFMKVFHLLEDACHSYDMQLAFINQPTNNTSSFSAYCVELHKLHMLKAKYAECKDELADLEEVMTYVAVCLGKDDSITNSFIKQVNEKKQSVKQMVRQKSIR